jgi:hypothetical protein
MHFLFSRSSRYFGTRHDLNGFCKSVFPRAGLLCVARHCHFNLLLCFVMCTRVRICATHARNESALMQKIFSMLSLYPWFLIFQILSAQPQALIASTSTVGIATSVVDSIAESLAGVSLDASVCATAPAASTAMSSEAIRGNDAICPTPTPTPTVYLVDDRTRFVWVTEPVPSPEEQLSTKSDARATLTAIDDTPAFGSYCVGWVSLHSLTEPATSLTLRLQ